VVASFQRIFKVSSPTSGTFYRTIVGAEKCLQTPATCTLEGGVEADESAHTVTIHLTQPDPEILDKLAVPHAVILPADAPAQDVGTKPIPGTWPIRDRKLRSEHGYEADAQPSLQSVERGCAAGRLSG
jgi:peptide/nickel transport system substrate-binding protein